MDNTFLPCSYLSFQHSTCDFDLFNFTALSGMTHDIFKYSHDWVLLSNNSLILYKNNKEKYWRQNLVTKSTLVWILRLRLRVWIFYKQSLFRTFMSLRISVRPFRAKNIKHGERFSWPLSIFSASQPIIKVLQYTDRCTDI